MEIYETLEEQAFRKEFRQWLVQYLPEVSADLHSLQDAKMDPESARRREFDRLLYRHGWAGLTWPREYGGRGGRLYQLLIFAEETARAQAPEVFNRLALGIVGPVLMRYGTEAQKSHYLPKMLSSEDIWCQGFSEPNAGSDLAALSTRAIRKGSEFVVNGQKIWTTLGQYADYCFLLARTSPDKPKHRGITAFIMNMRQDGITVRPIRQINGSQEFNEVFINDAVISADQVIGDVDGGWDVAMTALSFERSTNFINRQVRLTEDLTRLLSYARAHREHLAGDLTEQIVDIAISVHSLRLTVLRHIAELENGDRIPGPENNASKVFWSETHQQLASLALAMAGEQPHDAEYSQWAFSYLSSLGESIYAGTNEIQRNIIAERGLGLPR